MTQLVLPLSTAPRFTFESLVVHEGIEHVVATIQSAYTRDETGLPHLFLHGGPGTGKTHLLRASLSLVSASLGRERGVERLVSLAGLDGEARPLEKLVSEADTRSIRFSCVAIDDVHLLDPRETVHLWTLFNKMTRWGTPLLLASRLPVEDVFRENPHLASRVNSGLVLTIEPPQDEVRMLILDKMAGDRHVRISREVCSYLVTRKSRNIRELEEMLHVLDMASLEQQRRITLPFIKMLERDGLI